MKRAVMLICLALCLLLAGCSSAPATTLPATAGQASAPAPTPTPTAAQSPSPAATAAPSPAATAAPTPGVTSVPGASGLYIVVRNGLRGVVNGGGKEILPCGFVQIEPIVLSEQTAPALFFAVPRVVSTRKDPADPAGYLYSTDGKRISERSYRNVYALPQGCLQAFTMDAKMSFLRLDGSEILPGGYDEAYALDHGFVGVKGEPEIVKRRVDVFDASGKLTKSAEINFRGTAGDTIVVTDDAGGKLGLADSSFRKLMEPVWDDIRITAGGKYIVRKNDLFGVVSATGAEVLPTKYNDFAETGSDKYPFSAADAGGAYLMDESFRVVFQKATMRYLQYSDGMILGCDASNMTHALTMQGQDIIPPAVSINWIAKDGVFERYNSDYTMELYTKDGVKLPLPKANMLQAAAPDRYCVGVDAGGGKLNCGIYDGSGNEIVPLTYSELYPLGMGSLLVAGVTVPGGERRYGLIDADGKTVLPALYTSLYSSLYDGPLLYASVGPVHGLIDIHGNWVWHASDYDGLMD